ncbi:MAG: hypothetical protein EO766_11775 [Hydrotalea sp. AMD]|uniref:glycine zipper domain-containing protein n=1 Tax=Hydrotalea sp. AMD TaxID=2501297 RepID=UPI0010286055|nr:glycine zipper domain-containing protein [Hydrotalea sp. AMD]RWZ87203.1 MAG: hypothetical protein EO766_11775 [Hydrotalea sp. AMD]
MRTNKIFNVTALLAPILLVGCASMTGYSPVVDPYSDRNAMNLNRDYAQCEAIAKQSSSVGKDLLVQGGTGALIGGATGAALGAIFGNPAVGAAAGGTIGGLGGASKGGFEADERYKRVFRNCLRSRGHSVLD